MTEEEGLDWRRLEDLGRQVFKQGEPLELSDEIRALLARGARLVAISPADTEDALRSVSTARTLLWEIRRRIRDGSMLLGNTDSKSERLHYQGNFAGARKVLEEALAVEVVPHYREQLEIRLEYLATLETVFLTGHVEEDFHPWGQIRVLALRVQQGKSLELRDDLRAFLRQTAPSVAISEAEADEGLQSVEGAQALLAKMLQRIEDGKQRISQALYRMITCQEAGDPEGACQALRDVLAVETVPQYRRMAEENLAYCDKPLPDE
jgi:DUSAM domain-containing protein